ncbi:hypothetical protein DL98DRAFT_7829 [Cadophora sp. DSE1049]|nr:hypothetical protein DL98DRAFT_7829 [Cadophora sp. DSE1049]
MNLAEDPGLDGLIVDYNLILMICTWYLRAGNLRWYGSWSGPNISYLVDPMRLA